MNCFVCAKKKEDFEVWSNKIIIAATYDSKLQDNATIRKMDEKAMLCHKCMQVIIDKTNQDRR